MLKIEFDDSDCWLIRAMVDELMRNRGIYDSEKFIEPYRGIYVRVSAKLVKAGKLVV